jgi:hypothetical protein
LATRSDTSERIRKDTVFERFVKKGATLFNALGEKIQNAGKSAAKIHIRNEYKQIRKRVQEDVWCNYLQGLVVS